MSLHRGPQCPDGKVMCCSCFGRFEVADLSVDPEDGRPVDVCKRCATASDAVMAARREKAEGGNCPHGEIATFCADCQTTDCTCGSPQKRGPHHKHDCPVFLAWSHRKSQP